MAMLTGVTMEPLTRENALLVTLLAVSEITLQVIRARTDPRDQKKRYYLDRLDKDIEGLNGTFKGYLPEDFVDAHATPFHDKIEVAITEFLGALKAEEDSILYAIIKEIEEREEGGV